MGSPGNSAQRAAERQERDRQAAIEASVGRINSVFDSPGRQGQYDDLYKNTRQFYTEDLGRQKADTDRGLRFSMARAGQTGGSVAIDANRKVGEDFLRGTVEADRRAQAASSDLRNQDEQSRMNMLAMAQGGLDATTAGNQSATALRNNLLASKATSTANGMGSMFGDFSELFRRSKQDADDRRTIKLLNNLYQPIYGYKP